MSSEDSKYILAKKIARGGMAEIYLGKHVGEDGFQRLCAIKRILPHYAADSEFIQMFRDEAHICKRLQHNNIVRVEGFEEVEGSYAIIMEYVDGCDLRTLLHASEQIKKRLTMGMACHIIAEAARGLHYAHTKVDEITQQPLGIVHRDISPQNILVSFEGEVKITDFGIADAESKITETRPGIVKGKYSYMSPEQISAKSVDARTDVFALAIVLWEMLAMRRLFQGDNEVDTIQRVKSCKIDKELRDLNPEVDEELDNIIKKGLAKDPRRRFGSAGEFEKDLRRFMSRRFPEFTAQDLGAYLKETLDKRRAESAADIKKTLTETNQKPGGSKSGKKGSVDLALEGAGGPAISLAKSTVPTTPPRQASGPTGFSTQPLSSVRPAANTNFSRQSHTRGGPPSQPTRGRPTHKLGMLGMVAAFALCLSMGIVYILPAAKPAQLILRTQPARVKVTVDGRQLGQGSYLRATTNAPLILNLKPGPHTLMVERQGYTPYNYDFQAEDGQTVMKDDIVLKERMPLGALRIKMKPDDKRIRVDIDDGYFVATLVPGRLTAITPDLPMGHDYDMKVFYLGPKNPKYFTCRFTPTSTNWRMPNEVVIDRKVKKCFVK